MRLEIAFTHQRGVRFAVETTASLSPFRTSHAQPELKRVAAAFSNSALKLSPETEVALDKPLSGRPAGWYLGFQAFPEQAVVCGRPRCYAVRFSVRWQLGPALK